MTPSLVKPSDDQIRAFLAGQSGQGLSYPEVGQSKGGSPAGYDVDHNRSLLGHGDEAYHAACDALRRWEMFPRPWTEVHPPNTSFEVGNTVAVLFKVFGLWWINACRIVYLVDEEPPVRKFGFAYGTLPNHVEQGEERFTIEQQSDGSVWYDIRAFSRPRKWLVRFGYPIARRLQRRFVRDSQTVMRNAVSERRPQAPF